MDTILLTLSQRGAPTEDALHVPAWFVPRKGDSIMAGQRQFTVHRVVWDLRQEGEYPGPNVILEVEDQNGG
ncbi:hypothetical protein ABZX62_08690 [Streptomyces flavidovirens]|uniref:Uncharacterized protein n=1 Tax=Streptomyces flavidovirens TaxID=67298 RepID=A0ABW6RPE2_9ACTN